MLVEQATNSYMQTFVCHAGIILFKKKREQKQIEMCYAILPLFFGRKKSTNSSEHEHASREMWQFTLPCKLLLTYIIICILSICVHPRRVWSFILVRHLVLLVSTIRSCNKIVEIPTSRFIHLSFTLT